MKLFCFNQIIKRSAFLSVLIFSFSFISSDLFARDFSFLSREYKRIAFANYGKKVLPKHKIGISFIDIKSRKRISVNGNSVFPAASIIKIPIMAHLFYLYDKGLVQLDNKIFVKDSDKQCGAGVLQYLKPNNYSLYSLCKYMISISDNTATYVLSKFLGKSNINSYLKKIGLKNTLLLDETALIEKPNPNFNRTTPNEIANLLLKIQTGKGFSKYSRKQMLGFMKNQKYVFGIPKVLPRNFFCANKTGNLTNVLHDCAVVYSPRGDYVLCVFTEGFKKDREARFVINKVSKITASFYQ